MVTKNIKENEIEKEIVKKLKDSYPDMLDFNNCLKELRTFWFQSKQKDVLKEEIEFLKDLLEAITDKDFSVNYIKNRIEQLKKRLEQK